MNFKQACKEVLSEVKDWFSILIPILGCVVVFISSLMVYLLSVIMVLEGHFLFAVLFLCVAVFCTFLCRIFAKML